MKVGKIVKGLIPEATHRVADSLRVRITGNTRFIRRVQVTRPCRRARRRRRPEEGVGAE